MNRTDGHSSAARFRVQAFPRRGQWRAVARRWTIAAAVAAAFCLIIWFLMLRMPGSSHEGPLPPLDEATAALRTELEADVRALAGSIGERNHFRPAALESAAKHVETSFAASGLVPRRHEFKAAGQRFVNVIAEIAGGERTSEIVVVGAHYDSVSGCPGANDNATGAAGLLALARRFATAKPARTLRFVAFTNEEPPWFWTEQMGSLVYAKSCKASGDDVRAMLCLETLGCYLDEPSSQKYPAPGLSLVYPSRGNFVTFVGNVASRALVREAIGVFRERCAFPSEGAALPGWIPGIGWSDHWAFWQIGVPAVMVTDTAPFRYPHYHLASDTPDRIDYERFARVVGGLVPVVERLAEPAE